MNAHRKLIVVGIGSALCAVGCSSATRFELTIIGDNGVRAELRGGADEVHTVAAPPYATYNFSVGDPHVSVMTFTPALGVAVVEVPAALEKFGVVVTARHAGKDFSSEKLGGRGKIDVQGTAPLEVVLDVTVASTDGGTIRISGRASGAPL